LSLSVVDLYAGAGGLSLGFSQAGFALEHAVEIDGWAAETYRFNLGNHLSEQSVADFVESQGRNFRGVDVVVGGPPCQGFSISRRARRETAVDRRNDEVYNFIDAVELMRPRYVVFENVPQFESFHREEGGTYKNYLVEELTRLGYEITASVLRAIDFGVPQSRERFIAIGVARVANRDTNRPIHPFSEASDSSCELLGAWDAISDLPEVVPRTLSEGAVLQYEHQALNAFQAEMRQGSSEIYNHIPMRHTPRLIERFKLIGAGMNGVDVWEEASARKRSSNGQSGTKFDQNHRRMSANKPSPTITAHMYSTCLHPYQHRNITVREAARLQSFPDRFKFYGKRTTLSLKLLEKKGLFEDMKLSQLNQVGNAVPPMMARGLATWISQMEEALC
jgi:DNA (cytosine-5)-methyltransferase 1